MTTAVQSWSVPLPSLLKELGTSARGLSNEEAASRVKRYAERRLTPRKRADVWRLLLGQFASPIVLILLGATTISLFLQDFTDAAIILVIVMASCLLGFWQERGAAGAVDHLLIVAAYVMSGEVVKRLFYRLVSEATPSPAYRSSKRAGAT